MLVICNLHHIYEKYKARWIKQQTINGFMGSLSPIKLLKTNLVSTPKLWNHLNNEGLTPLTLAAHLGRTKMLAWLLNERKIVQWSYGDVSCVLHPLDQLDLGFDEEVKKKCIEIHIFLCILIYSGSRRTTTLCT